MIAVCVINWNRIEMLRRCLEALRTTDAGADFVLSVNDVGSTDESQQLLRDYQRFFSPEVPAFDALFDAPREDGIPARGYAASVNRMLGLAFTDPAIKYAFPLNNDNIVTDGWLSGCLERYEQDDKIGHVGGTMLYGPSWPEKAGKVQSAGACFIKDAADNWVTKSYHESADPHSPEVQKEYDAWYLGFGMYRRDVFLQLGGLCEDYPPIYYDDPDYAFRVWRAGYRVSYTPKSVVVHDHFQFFHEDPNRKHHNTTNAGGGENRARFMRRWGWWMETASLPKPRGIH